MTDDVRSQKAEADIKPTEGEGGSTECPECGAYFAYEIDRPHPDHEKTQHTPTNYP